jgi:site-specific recombinase XerC
MKGLDPNGVLQTHGTDELRHRIDNGRKFYGNGSGAAEAHPTASTKLPPCSDEALALLFAAKHSDELRYTHTWGRWHRFDGTRWIDDATLLAFDYARRICREAAATTKSLSEQKQVASAMKRAAVTSLAREDRRLAATSDQWDRDLSLGLTSIRYVKQASKQFGLRHVGDIPEQEWSAWVDKLCRNVKSESRERLLNTIMAFLCWCAKKPRRWGTAPTFDRDKEARNPRRRARRPVKELSMPLIRHLFAHASPHLAGQMWAEWSTGARVSSILHGCSLSDLILAPGREQITYHNTKNGETITSHLHPLAAEALREYLKVRGRLHDRDGPLFLTEKNKPYRRNAASVQNRTAFQAMKRRARTALRKGVMPQVRAVIAGNRQEALEMLGKLRADHRLLGRVTQHWFRHMLATKMRGDIRAAMDQGGWIDERSVMAYTIDVPAHRRRLVNEMHEETEIDTRLTRGDFLKRES